jgi:spermidine/putrescine transport system permease protein
MRRNNPVIVSVSMLAIVMLYLPLFGVAVFSVNSAKYGWVWQEFTLKWYLDLLHNEYILGAAWNTLVLAVVSTLISTVIGTLLAIGIGRYPWGNKTNSILDILIHFPVVIPDIVMAGSLVVVFSLLRALSTVFEPGMVTMIIGHITFQIAFVALVVRSRLVAISTDLEEAARDLFASNLYFMRRILLPLLMPGIIAGAMLAFTLSLDDFVISFFTSGPKSQTLPLYIYSAVRRGVTPQIHALSTIVVLLTVILVVAAERVSRTR